MLVFTASGTVVLVTGIAALMSLAEDLRSA